MAKAVARTSSARCKRSAKASPKDLRPDQDAEWLRALFDRADDGMAIADIQTKRLIRANPALCRMLGYTLDEFCRLSVKDIHPADRLADAIAAFKRQADGIAGISRDMALLRKDGGIFYADINSSVVTFNGRPHLLGIFHDVTERRRTEAELQASEARYRAATELLSDYIFRVRIELDGRAVIETVSGNFERITGRRLPDIEQPDAWLKILHPEDRPRMVQVLQRLIREGGENHSEFQTVVLRSGMEVPRWVEVSARAETDSPTGRVKAIIGAVRDVTDRKAAELQQRLAAEALQASEARLRKIIEQSPMSMAIVGMDGTIEFINRKAIETFGYLPEDIPNMDRWWVQAYPDEAYRTEVIATWTGHVERALAENREIRGGEYRVTCKDGSLKTVFIFGVPVADKVFVMFNDITAQKHAARAIEDERLFSDSIIEGLPGVFYLFDENGRILRWNRNFEVITGYSAAEFPNLSPLDFFRGPDREHIAQRIQKVFAEGAADAEAHLVFKNGEQAHYYFTGLRIVFDERPCLIGVGLNITARKQAENALEQNERFLRVLSENLADGMVYQINSGADGQQRVFSYLSPAVEQLHGLKEDDVKKDPSILYAQFIDEDRALLVERENYCAATRTPLDIEARVRLPSGEIRWRHFKSTPRSLPDGSVVWDGIEFDITERKQMQERLRQSEKLTAIGQLAGGIAHDFNNQLAGVMGYASLLESRLDEGPLKRYAQGIAVSARRAADLTQQLLAFSRKGKYLSVPVDIHRLLAEVVAILERSIDKRIRISQVLRATHPSVSGDPTQLQNALLNLALNARDAMAQGGELTFETESVTLDETYCRDSTFDIAPGPYLCVRVTDTGCGMTDEVKQHLFEPFFTTKDVGAGTGMGLASVYGTVRNHHGDISVTTEPDHGTTFRICLPLDPTAARSEQTVPAGDPRRGSACILLVDDEQIVREMAAVLLRDLGYQVTTFTDGQQAIEYYREHWQEVDLVILDMVMPRMGGRDTFVAMREINPEVRALLSSGYSLNGEAQAILDEGVQGFIGKPYQQSELGQRVAEALHSPSSDGR